MIKLIVSDLDGTLLTKENKILEEDIHALQKATAANIDICIATGRMDNDILEVLKMVNGCFHRISQNGAFVFTKDDNELHSIYFDNTIANQIYEQARSEKTITLVCDQQTNFVEKKDDEVKKIEKRMFFPIVENPQILENIGTKIKPSKITILGFNIEDQQRDITNNFNDYVDTFISEKYCLDIMPKNISKGQALTKLLNHLNISPDEMACIGDSFNDIPMFKLTPNSFAMSHASQDVKKHATYIVDNVCAAINMILEDVQKGAK